MNNVVKLILICQIKDDYIPQLIPLIWINSIFMVFVILFIIIVNYFYKNIYMLNYKNGRSNIYINIKW